MRRVRYRVATSLDGYIAGPNGEIDWIVPDPTIDLRGLVAAQDGPERVGVGHDVVLTSGKEPVGSSVVS